MTAALILLAVAALMIRQFRARELRPALLVGAPLVLVAFAAQGLDRTPPAGAAAAAFLGLGVAVAAGLGILRGRSERVWHAADGSILHQGTLATGLLWLATFGARAASMATERMAGVHVALGPEIELVCGASLAAQFTVVAWRAGLVTGLRPATN
jgi:hypothetical protein